MALSVGGRLAYRRDRRRVGLCESTIRRCRENPECRACAFVASRCQQSVSFGVRGHSSGIGGFAVDRNSPDRRFWIVFELATIRELRFFGRQCGV
jgi:hypothetical protein